MQIQAHIPTNGSETTLKDKKPIQLTNNGSTNFERTKFWLMRWNQCIYCRLEMVT